MKTKPIIILLICIAMAGAGGCKSASIFQEESGIVTIYNKEGTVEVATSEWTDNERLLFKSDKLSSWRKEKLKPEARLSRPRKDGMIESWRIVSVASNKIAINRLGVHKEKVKSNWNMLQVALHSHSNNVADMSETTEKLPANISSIIKTKDGRSIHVIGVPRWLKSSRLYVAHTPEGEVRIKESDIDEIIKNPSYKPKPARKYIPFRPHHIGSKTNNAHN